MSTTETHREVQSTPSTSESSTPLHLGFDVRRRAEEAARADGVSLSAWVEYVVAAKVTHRERLINGLAAMRQWEAEDPIPEEYKEAARRELEEAGVLRPRDQP